jgi:hypothetical protein
VRLLEDDLVAAFVHNFPFFVYKVASLVHSPAHLIYELMLAIAECNLFSEWVSIEDTYDCPYVKGECFVVQQ